MSSSSIAAWVILLYIINTDIGTASAVRVLVNVTREDTPSQGHLEMSNRSFVKLVSDNGGESNITASALSNGSSAAPAEPPTPSMVPQVQIWVFVWIGFWICITIIGIILSQLKVCGAPTPPSTPEPTPPSTPQVELQSVPSGRARPHGEVVYLQQPGAYPRPMLRVLED